MKSIKRTKLFFILVSFMSSILFADTSITRGPVVGEIYYIGPTVTGQGIYHSTDFGETATCMDSTLNTNILFQSITADLTSGVLYGYSMPENLYISYNYGQHGGWIFRNTSYWDIHSGRHEGEIFDCIVKHSTDYGQNFISHSMNGFFGNFLTSENDIQDSVAYAVVSQTGIPDSLWLLITYDNYETLELQTSFNINEINIRFLSRGVESGELFCITNEPQKLYFSDDNGYSWELKNTFNCPNLPITGIVGGRQLGELYMNVEYKQLMCTIQHTYIYHSLDYGETFDVFHVFSCGDEPFYANFTATPDSGSAPLTVQFTDISSGVNNQIWQWDFDGDGEIDSTEQNPLFTYQNPGIYNASLTIFISGQSEMTATREIVVGDSVAINNFELLISKIGLSNYPNPFNPSTEIRLQVSDLRQIKNPKIEIYNLKGQKIRTLLVSPSQSLTVSVVWNGTGENSSQVSSGIYFYKLNVENSPIKKMILLK